MNYTPSIIEIYKKNQGIVLSELSILALDKATGKIQAVGYEAKYKEGSDVLVKSPLKDGRVADWNDSAKLFKHFLYQAGVGRKVFAPRPKIAVCMLPDATQVENQAMEELMMLCGAKKVVLTELSLAEFLSSGRDSEWDYVISIRQE